LQIEEKCKTASEDRYKTYQFQGNVLLPTGKKEFLRASDKNQIVSDLH